MGFPSPSIWRWQPTLSRKKSGIFRWICAALLAYLVRILCYAGSTAASHQVAYHVLEGLRLRLAVRFLHAPLGEVQSHSIGEIKNVLIDKIKNIEPPLAHVVPEGAGHLVLPVLSIAALAPIDWRIALASLVTFPAALLCMALTFQISGKNFDTYNQSTARMNSTIVEYIEGIEVIKAFGRAGVITAPEAALAVMLSLSMVGSLAKLEVFGDEIKQMQLTVEELEAMIHMESLPEPTEKAVLHGTDVELKNVHFSYSGNAEDEVLHGIVLTLPQGSFTALVGPSGGGKSTVAKLIARFWDVTGGSISIGGVNIQNMPLAQVSEIVSFVSQDNFLFRCSLLENIRLGNPKATDEEVKAAARAAQCEEFIQKLPSGYDTPAGEAGKRLSGGEKQRIAIARMILKNAPVVILDEATASVDPENEHLIQNAVTELTRGKTIISIAHRLATIEQADQILVVDDGRICECGTHAELIRQDGKYRQFVKIREKAEGWKIG